MNGPVPALEQYQLIDRNHDESCPKNGIWDFGQNVMAYISQIMKKTWKKWQIRNQRRILSKMVTKKLVEFVEFLKNMYFSEKIILSKIF